MKLSSKIIFPLILLLSVTNPLLVAAQTYSETNSDFFNSIEILKLGSENYFVKILQQYLNKDLETQVSNLGFGSIGQETDYFGLKTDSAVKRFQQKFAEDILKPAGLEFPSGLVGVNTKKKIFNLYESASSTKTNIVKTETIKDSEKTKIENNPKLDKKIFGTATKEVALIKNIFSNAVKAISSMLTIDSLNLSSSDSFNNLNGVFSQLAVYNSSQFQVAPGATTTINGSGFLKTGNDFYVGGTKIANVSCQSSISCDIKIPTSLDEGQKNIILENEKGSTKDQKFTPHIKISKNPKPASVLNEISPSSISNQEIDKEITIKGSGLASKENYVHILMGHVGPVSSSNGEIKFKLSDIENMTEFVKGLNAAKARDVQLPIMIENEFGVSNYVVIKMSYVN